MKRKFANRRETKSKNPEILLNVLCKIYPKETAIEIFEKLMVGQKEEGKHE